MKRTKEELEKLGVIDPEFKKETQKNPMPVFTGNTIEQRKQRAEHLKALRHLYPVPGPIPGVVETNATIAARDGYEIPVKVYQPLSPPDNGSPLIVMYHEGGWCMGDPSDEDQNCRMFCKNFGAVCVNVDYRLGPEHPFPTGVHDSWDALKWVATQSSSLNANPSLGFIVGGSSAGGNLTAVLTHLAREERLSPPLTGQYLSVPALLPHKVVPKKYESEYLSHYTNKSDPVLGDLSRVINGIADVLKSDVNSPLFVPFNDPSGHHNLPPAYFQICGMDPLRDEGLIYERVLREECAIPTRLDLYAGFGHMFWTNWPELPASSRFVADTLTGFEWLLSLSANKREDLRS